MSQAREDRDGRRSRGGYDADVDGQGHIPTPVQRGCAGVQGGRGGKGLAFVTVRQKVNHRKENLRRRTDLSLGRETYAARMVRHRRGLVHIRRVKKESPQRLRERRFCS